MKVIGLPEAVESLVADGDWVHVAYGGARPTAALLEVTRQTVRRQRSIGVSAAGLSSVHLIPLIAEIASQVRVSFLGENYPNARPNPAATEWAARHSDRLQLWSLFSMVQSLQAAALGLPYMPIRSVVGSDLAQGLQARGELAILPNPFGDASDEVAVVRPYRPDVVLMHGLAADARGNVLLPPPYGEDAASAYAARKGVVATVERVVSDEQIRSCNAYRVVPGFLITSVCLVPRGSHPFAVYSPVEDLVTGYPEDRRFFQWFYRNSASMEIAKDWAREFVLSTGSFDEYLSLTEQARRSSDVG